MIGRIVEALGDCGDRQRPLPRRPRPGGRQLAGRRAGGRAPDRVHHQRHRRAGRQLLARRNRHGPRRSARDRLPVRTGIHTEHLYPGQPAAQQPHHVRPAAEQGDRRPQRVRARGRHPPGRLPEGAHDLRDHRAAIGGRAREPAGAREAQRPPRAAQPRCEDLGFDSDRASNSTHLSRASPRWRTGRRRASMDEEIAAHSAGRAGASSHGPSQARR